jgi:hypothetical protein
MSDKLKENLKKLESIHKPKKVAFVGKQPLPRKPTKTKEQQIKEFQDWMDKSQEEAEERWGNPAQPKKEDYVDFIAKIIRAKHQKRQYLFVKIVLR